MPAARPSPDTDAAAARRCLDRSNTVDRHLADLEALQAIGHALLAVAGQLEALREHGMYRTGDGA